MPGKYEVLAPAGCLDDVRLMINEKADAIYIGLQGFSSRPQKADFCLDSIEEAVTLCHEANVKIYVAINANVAEADMERLKSEIFILDDYQVDAIILSEFGLIAELQGKLQHAAIHASTLLGVYNIETVRLLKNLGVSRIIFYANLYFDEMAAITNAIPDLEYELVAEGGTCFNDIRQCKLPHGFENGEHILFCRKSFEIQSDDCTCKTAKQISEHPTRTAEIVGLYMAIGITSFKIEGRTVDGRLRVPMVRDLLCNIERFNKGMPLKSYLHYFSRTNREMR